MSNELIKELESMQEDSINDLEKWVINNILSDESPKTLLAQCFEYGVEANLPNMIYYGDLWELFIKYTDQINNEILDYQEETGIKWSFTNNMYAEATTYAIQSILNSIYSILEAKELME